MKNLHQLYNKYINTEIKNIKCLTLDTISIGTAYLCDDNHVYSLHWDTKSFVKLLDLKDGIGLEHLTLTNELCIGTENGNVIVYNLDEKTSQIVSFCDGGIELMSWSPDQEIVIFITKATKNLVILNSFYDSINEIPLDDLTKFGDQEFMTVGWGKKETQFHGSEGKAAATRKIDSDAAAVAARAKENAGSDNIINKNISIAWRGDCEYFAVSFYNSNDGERLFKVYNKEGNLQYTCEKSIGLQSPMCWRPSGLWIAIPQLQPKQYVIALYEKNGLKHREIILPFTFEKETVKNLIWSNDSEILAIHTANNNNNKLESIYLYTICNYHWYLKQCLEFESKIIVMQWDNRFSEGKTLHVFLENGTYCQYRFDYTINHSNGVTIDDETIVCVIDGKKLLFTNFRSTVVPPPMSAHTIDCTEPINYVEFLRHSTVNVVEPESLNATTNAFLTINSKYQLLLYQCKFKAKTPSVNNLIKHFDSINCCGQFQLKEYLNIENKIPMLLQHLIWLNEKHLIVTYIENNIIYLQLLEIVMAENKINLLDKLQFSEIIISITDLNDKQLIICLTNGIIQKLSIESNKFVLQTNLYQLPEYCEQVLAISLPNNNNNNNNNNTINNNNDNIKIFSLKLKQTLYLNQKKIAQDVTSMYLTDLFLIFTTLNQLKFLRLTDNEITTYERRMERGGKIIVNVPKDSKIVIQMPRGNLEVIQPRILSLCIIANYLDTCQYKLAFDLLRKQRINLNLLVDHDPIKFLNEIEHFIDQIDNVQWLNLFLTDLQNEDCTITMYSYNYTDRIPVYPDELWFNNKINIVCEEICTNLTVCGEEFPKTKTLPIITSYVKRKDLESALQLIWNIKQMESNINNNNNTDIVNTKSDTVGVRSIDALRYLLYLVDVNELYNVALGMYDFDLVLFIATKSQKDPKEYLPFLNNLKNVDENYRKYKIDNYLKRYDKSLEHILKCNESRYDECLELIEKHNLYSKALQLLTKNCDGDGDVSAGDSNDMKNVIDQPSAEQKQQLYKKIVSLFANHLRINGKFVDACLMYERCGDYHQAILTAKHFLDWRKCLTLLKLSNMSEEDSAQHILTYVPALQENSRHREAADLVKIYQNNYDTIVDILLNGKLYNDAIYEASIYADELIERKIRPHLKNYTNLLILSFDEVLKQFLAYKNRLMIIRQEKDLKRLTKVNGFNDDGNYNNDDSDTFSDTSSTDSSKYSSNSSRGTGRSHRSSKNRRKHERKLLSLKEGNPFEDIALIDTLYNLILKCYNQQNHVNETCKALVNLQMDFDGAKLQQIFSKLLICIQNSVDEIWIPEMITTKQIPTDGNINYVSSQDDQHYALIKPNQRFKPQLAIIDWEFELLK